MKKLLITLIAVSAIAAACNSQPVTVSPSPTPTPAPTPTPTPVTPTTQTYSNATYGFVFDYPLYMQFVTPVYPNLQDKIVQVQIPQTNYPGTNFGDASFSVSAQSAKSLADCLKLTPPENGDGFKTKVSINGVDFYMTKSSGAGAGNLYESNVYRTVKAPNGACLELNETIHTSNIANYPTGTTAQVDMADVQAKLDSVLHSFKFN